MEPQLPCPKCHYLNAIDATVCLGCDFSLFPDQTRVPDTGQVKTPHVPGISQVETLPEEHVSLPPAESPPLPDAHVFEPGEMLADRYLIIEELGRGGMGTVYKVDDTRLTIEREQALKVIHKNLLSNDTALQLFEEEVFKCRQLKSDHVITVYDLNRLDNDTPFFTMELIHGRSLRREISRRQSRGDHFSLEEACAIIYPVLNALGEAHQKNIIHQDIKPENIMLSDGNGNPIIKVLDFGIARSLTPTQLSRTFGAQGSAFYMAPEQVHRAMKIDPRTDLYALAVVLYEMLTGRIPMGIFPTPSEVNSNLPPEIDAFIRDALNFEPEKRFENAAQMEEALAAIENEDPFITIVEQASAEVRIERTESLKNRMINIPGGTVRYLGGLTFSIEDFQLDESPLTREQIGEFIELTLRQFKKPSIHPLLFEMIWTVEGVAWLKKSGKLSSGFKSNLSSDAPVDSLTWYEAAAYCNWRTLATNHRKLLSLTDMNEIDSQMQHIFFYGNKNSLSANSIRAFRLPTEIELFHAKTNGGIRPSGYEFTTSSFLDIEDMRPYQGVASPLFMQDSSRLMVDNLSNRKKIMPDERSGFKPRLRCITYPDNPKKTQVEDGG